VNRFLRSALFPVVVITLIVWLGTQTLMSHKTKAPRETTSQANDLVKTNAQSIDEVIFNPNKHQAEFRLKEGKKFSVYYATDQAQLRMQTSMEDHGVTYDSKGIGTSAWWSILTSLLPFVLLFGFWIFLMNQVQGGGSKVMSFGKSRAKRMTPDSPKIGFKDVAGVDEAVEELQEIKEFLENPKKFQALGARIPKGVLLYGPPGRVRLCSRARSPARRACRSFRFLAPTSSRCSSASARRECATSSSRRSRPRRASSSWTRSTLSVAIVVPVSAEATTSVSRR